MNETTRLIRWTMVAAFASVVLLGTLTGHRASAEQTTPQGAMNTTTVMLPMSADSEMVSITVRMPMTMISMTGQPSIQRIPGVGYEIDYGGPSILIERLGQD